LDSSSPPQSLSVINIKKAKLFVTPNRYSSLPIEEPNLDNDVFNNTNQEQLNTPDNTPKKFLPPPIFIKGVLNFIGLRNNLIDIMGPDTFSCKSTSSASKSKHIPWITIGTFLKKYQHSVSYLSDAV